MRRELKAPVAMLAVAIVLSVLNSAFSNGVARGWASFSRSDVTQGGIRAIAIVLGPLCLFHAWKGWYRDRVRFARWRATLGVVGVGLLTYSWLAATAHLLPWLIRGPKPWSDVMASTTLEFVVEIAASYCLVSAILLSFFLDSKGVFFMWSAGLLLLLTHGLGPAPTL